MPLPPNDAPWPPTVDQELAGDHAVADAWWSGDPARLSHVYGGLTGTQAHEQRRPSRRRFADWFWGRQVDDPAKARERIHVPAAADIAATGADLLFGGDELRLQVPEAHEKSATNEAKQAEDAVTDLADRLGLAATLLEAAELCGALGGVYLRPTWDTAVAGPVLAVIHADRAVPEWRWGQLVAVTFWSVVEDTGSVVWRHLERHEMAGPGKPVVLHGLYRGTRDRLGARVMNLKAHPATAGIDADSDGLTVAPAGVDTLMARYVPNVRPNRRHRHRPEGRPDTQGAEALMSALDETMSSWMRDLRLGQRRIIVPDQFLDRAGRGQGAGFDVDREVFSALAIEPSPSRTSDTIEVVDFALRVEEHDRTARALFERVVAVANYSPSSFGIGAEGGQQTATEVRSREDRSLRTTQRKRRYWEPEVGEVLWQLQAIAAGKFGGPAPARARVVWPDLTATDTREVASSLNLLALAKAASIETKVRMLHPEWDDPEVVAEVDRIRTDEGLGVDDPTGGFP